MMDNVKGMLKSEEAAKSARNAAASAVARDAAAARQVSQLKRCLCVSGASDGYWKGGRRCDRIYRGIILVMHSPPHSRGAVL